MPKTLLFCFAAKKSKPGVPGCTHLSQEFRDVLITNFWTTFTTKSIKKMLKKKSLNHEKHEKARKEEDHKPLKAQKYTEKEKMIILSDEKNLITNSDKPKPKKKIINRG